MTVAWVHLILILLLIWWLIFNPMAGSVDPMVDADATTFVDSLLDFNATMIKYYNIEDYNKAP